MATSRICSIPDCGKPACNVRGWCGSHYQRWRRHGDPLSGGTYYGQPLEYLETIVRSYAGEDCLIWPYGQNGVGYGIIYYKQKNVLVSRLICAEVNGAAPSPQCEAAHVCGNGHLGCVNSRHIKWKTPIENAQDKQRHGTMNRGERVVFAKLEPRQIREIRKLDGRVPRKEIAARFNVTISNISVIIRRKSWAWVS